MTNSESTVGTQPRVAVSRLTKKAGDEIPVDAESACVPRRIKKASNGEMHGVIATSIAVACRKSNGAGDESRRDTDRPPVSSSEISAICEKLQHLQRRRSVALKGAIMQENYLRSCVAVSLGYETDLDEKSREKKFAEARKVIKSILDDGAEHELSDFVRGMALGIDAARDLAKDLAKTMVKLVNRLPVHTWLELPEQKGAGALGLATIIGETGDLFNYANPAKVWKRMGCAPYEAKGKVQMGGTWKSKGGLSADDWTIYGYSPRRRSVAWNVGKGLMMQKGQEECAEGDGDGLAEVDSRDATPYRARYLAAKVAMRSNHPKDKEYPDARCNNHGLLLCVKLFLKNLWIEWHKHSTE